MIIVPTEKQFDWRHAPLVLIVIVVINLLVFFIYQAGDNNKIALAVSSYLQADFLKEEWPIYQDYLKEADKPEEIKDSQDLFDKELYQQLAFQMLNDTDYYKFLMHNQRTYFYDGFLSRWLPQRQDMQRLIDSLSFNQFGLKSKEFSILGLFSHQFLHGDMMHLFGNLFFLVICGFAVEAAIGHKLFAIFYLVSGVIAGLTHFAFHLNTASTLIGASGAISGVMAMYLAVFRLQKIEFFYWIFFFVGYFRAPALMILPFYIGKEVFEFVSDTQGGVAFMAHAGGFVAGAALIFGALKLKPEIVNVEYIETDQSVDPARQSLADVYYKLERFQFTTAYKQLQVHINEFGSNFTLDVLTYTLQKLCNSPNLPDTVLRLLERPRPNRKEIQTLAKIWRDNPKATFSLPAKTQVALANQFCQEDSIDLAESIFVAMQNQRFQHPSMGVLARKLAKIFEHQKQISKAKTYREAAETIIQAAHNGSL